MTETLTKAQERKPEKKVTLFSSLPGYPWLNPCPRCGFRGSCDCTVLERARAVHPGLTLNESGAVQ